MTMNEIQDSIIGDFSRLNDWMQKYEYLTELGRNLQCTGSFIKSEQYALHGCQSQVWIRAEMLSDKINFTADSDSLIIKGILALILKVLNNRKPEELLNADLYFLKGIGLHTNLSPSRVNGVAAILKTMRHWGELFLKLKEQRR